MDRRSGRLASTRRGLGCSSVCSRDAVDRESGARRRETPRLPVQSGSWTTWTRRTFVDDGRLTHNPEVGGSNPPPATSFRRSRPFPGRERAFCVPGAVVKRVVKAALHAAWQRDGGDGVARAETAWTGWTLRSSTAGCVARRYRRCTNVGAGPSRARTHARISVSGGAITRRGRGQCPCVEHAPCRFRAVDGDMAVPLRSACSARGPVAASGGVGRLTRSHSPRKTSVGNVRQVRQMDEAARLDDELYRLKHVSTWAVSPGRSGRGARWWSPLVRRSRAP